MQLPQILHRQPEWSELDQSQCKANWQAANDLVGSLQLLSERGSSVVQSMVDDEVFVEWEHYPNDDVRDKKNASQYFYHAHPGTQRPFEEHGHFHLFVHAEKIGLRRPDARYSPAPAHVLAVSMDAQGLPNGFFLVNRWVTKGPWLSFAEGEIALQHFQVKGRHGKKAINVFLKSLLQLYQAPILALLQQGEHIMQQLCAERDRRSVFADKSIEVLCYLPIQLMSDIAALEDAFANESPQTTAHHAGAASLGI